MYLEREQWKKFLREVDKQVKWRYENFGTPPIIKDREEEAPLGEADEYKANIGKGAATSRKCSLWKNPEENISTRLKILNKNEAVKIIDYDEIGMYKVEVTKSGLKGWIWITSITFDEVETNELSLLDIQTRDKEDEGTEDSDPVEDKTGEKGLPQPEIIPTMTHEEFLK